MPVKRCKASTSPFIYDKRLEPFLIVEALLFSSEKVVKFKHKSWNIRWPGEVREAGACTKIRNVFTEETFSGNRECKRI